MSASTIGTFAGNEQPLNARRTESVDAPFILLLSSEKTHKQFGNVNVVHLIEKANLSVTLCNLKNEVLGFSAFVDYPQFEYEICEDNLWEKWIPNLGVNMLNMCTPINSMFMHYFTAQQEFTMATATEIIRAVFNAVPELYFVLLLIKRDQELEPALANIFKPAHTFKCKGGEFTLYTCQRHNHIPTLHIREAVVEDTDDLTPLFTNLDSLLTQSYGDYFISEAIESQSDHHHCLAAEADGKAVGFMSISSAVNLEFLQDTYELDVFHGLAKPHRDDDLVKAESETSMATISSVSVDSVDPNDEAAQHEGEEGSGAKQETDAKEGEEKEESATKADGDGADGGAKADEDDVASNAGGNGRASVRSNPSRHSSIEGKLSDAHMCPSPLTNDKSLQEGRVVLNPMYSQLVEGDDKKKRKEFRPIYAGKSNAFTIQLFCIEEMHEMRSVDFLPRIFKLFPDKDFAVISLPHLVPEFPLIQNFVRVTPRIGSNSPHELYVFHRHGLLSSNFVVRKARTDDLDKVKTLVEKIAFKERLIADVEKYNDARRDEMGKEIQVFVADCRDQVVGICVISREEDIEYIRSHYNIEDFIYYNHHRRDEHGHLHHFVLNPIFQNFSKMFLKEVLRQGEKSSLYYPVYAHYDNGTATQHSLITGLNYLVPIRPRRQICYPMQELGENLPSDRILNDQLPYALNHINRKLTLEPKVVVNASIVVVGASDVALSFLEILCFCPHLRFNNLILVSRRGFPNGEFDANVHTFSNDDIAKMSLRTWVTAIKGTMIGLNRGHKQIILNDGSTVSYDYLILCNGQQYHIPDPTGCDLQKLATNHDLTPAALYRPFDEGKIAPENVIALNDDYEYEQLVSWAVQLIEDHEQAEVKKEMSPVVIYGRNFASYLVVQLLINCGLKGSQVVLVRPPLFNTQISANDDDGNMDTFNEPAISKLVEQAMQQLHVKVLEDHVLAKWTTKRNNVGNDVVTHVSFTTDTKPLDQLPVSALVCLHPKRINYETFTALNDSCIVFDGRLTIDADFKTNDPLVRAAGPLVKYSRRYHAAGSAFRPENQSSREIGFRLAMSVLPIFDPTLEHLISPAEEHSSKDTIDLNQKLVPLYHEPKVIKGELPGGFTYLHVRKPGARSVYELDVDKSDHGTEIVTGDTMKGNYFRLHINQYNCVETITCLVSAENYHMMLPASNILQLYGVHERFLNNLKERFNDNLIADLYAYFRQPWSMILFHDRFPDFKQEIREILSSSPVGADNIPSIEAMVNSLVDEDLVIDESQRELLLKHFEAVGQRRSVEKKLLNFISYNYYHLPMYAKPGMI